MPETYIATLDGIRSGEPVTFDNKPITASNEEEAKAEALRWANDLLKQVGGKATLTLKQGAKGVYSHVFEDA